MEIAVSTHVSAAHQSRLHYGMNKVLLMILTSLVKCFKQPHDRSIQVCYPDLASVNNVPIAECGIGVLAESIHGPNCPSVVSSHRFKCLPQVRPFCNLWVR